MAEPDDMAVLNSRVEALEGVLSCLLRQMHTLDRENPIERMLLELAALANRGVDADSRAAASLALDFVQAIND